MPTAVRRLGGPGAGNARREEDARRTYSLLVGGMGSAVHTAADHRSPGGPKHLSGWSRRQRRDPGPTGAATAGRLVSQRPGNTRCGGHRTKASLRPTRHPACLRSERPMHEPLRQHEACRRPTPTLALAARLLPPGRGDVSGYARRPDRAAVAPRCPPREQRPGRDTMGIGQPVACRSRSAPRGRGLPRRRGGLPASRERSAPPACLASGRGSGADIGCPTAAFGPVEGTQPAPRRGSRAVGRQGRPGANRWVSWSRRAARDGHGRPARAATPAVVSLPTGRRGGGA